MNPNEINYELLVAVLICAFTLRSAATAIWRRYNLKLYDGILPRGRAILHSPNCQDCNRKTIPAQNWGAKHITMQCYLDYLDNSPDKLFVSRSRKYVVCPECGGMVRRGITPRGPKGREELRQVDRYNAAAINAVNTLARWERFS